ncbi:MAG: hypothetical protein HY721_11430, partial [Planctomycetes bacterium]|nr:hypothetical protein [Planctomycetota bacterium]
MNPPDDPGPAGPPSRLGGVPKRELRLLVGGIREWLTTLSRKGGSPGFIGVLEAHGGQGQSEILGAVHDACRDLGINALWGRSREPPAFPPGVIGDLVAQGLGSLAAACQGGDDGRCLSPEVCAEAEKVLGLAPALGVPSLPRLGHELEHARLVDALARCLLELTKRSPLLVLIEDLPGADPLTLEVLRHLFWMLHLRRVRGGAPRLLVIVTAPPGADISDLLAARDVPLKDAEAFRIAARGLSRDDLRDLASRVLGQEGPLTFRERIFRLTGGSVRHTKWLLWSVKENGGLEGKEAKLPDQQLGLDRLVERRLQALAGRERRWVCTLAALGRPCGADFLRVLAGPEAPGVAPGPGKSPAGPEEPEAIAAALVARGWAEVLPQPSREIGEAGPGACAAGGPVYALDAEVARIVLDLVPSGEFEDVRRRLGEVLLAKADREPRFFPEAFRQRLASGAEPAAAGLAAAGYLEGLGCPVAALEVLDECLEARLDREPEASRRVRDRRVALLFETGSFREALEACGELLESAAGAEERARLLRLSGELQGKLGEKESQVGAYGKGLAQVEADAGSCERLKLLASLARVHLEAAELERSLEYLDACLEVVASRGLAADKEYLEIYRLAEEVHFRRHDYVEAREFERTLLARCEANGDVLGQLRSLRHLAHLHGLRGEWEEAEAYLVESIRVARGTGCRALLGQAFHVFGRFLGEHRDKAAALKQLRQAAAVMMDLGKLEDSHRIECAILELELALGRFEDAARSARACAEGWLGLLPASTSVPGDPAGPLRQAHLLEQQGRYEDARRACQDCLLHGAAAPGLRSRAATALGRLATLQGEYDQALACFEQGLACQSTSPDRGVLAESYLEVSTVFLERADLARAHEYTWRGLRLALEVGTAEGILRAFGSLAAFLDGAGLHGPAAEVAAGLLRIAEALQTPAWELAARRQLLRAMVRGADPRIPVAAGSRWLELLG